MTSTMIVDSKFRFRSSNVARAEVQKLSPEIAAKLVEKRVKNSKIWNNHEKHARRNTETMPCPIFAPTLSIKLFKIMEIVIIKLERQAVPNDGPTAFLPYHNIATIFKSTFQHMLKIHTNHSFKPTARKGDTK